MYIITALCLVVVRLERELLTEQRGAGRAVKRGEEVIYSGAEYGRSWGSRGAWIGSADGLFADLYWKLGVYGARLMEDFQALGYILRD